MTRKDIITNSGYWEEYANAWKYNKSTDTEIAKDIIRVINEALNMADVGDSLPDDFDEWIAKVENECVIDMDLPHIIWHDFFKPRGIFPKHAKRDKQCQRSAK